MGLHAFTRSDADADTLPVLCQTWNFGWDFAAVTAITMAAYTWFTIQTTAWRSV